MDSPGKITQIPQYQKRKIQYVAIKIIDTVMEGQKDNLNLGFLNLGQKVLMNLSSV